MDLDTLARNATRELLEQSAPDVPSRYVALQHTRVRRTATRLIAIATAVAVTAGVWQLVHGSERSIEPAPPTGTVTNGALLGLDYTEGTRARSWDTVLGDRPEHLPTDQQVDAVLQFAPDGSFVYYADDQGRLATWNLTTDEKRVLLTCPRRQCWGATVSPGGTTAVLFGTQGLELWSLETGERLHVLEMPHGVPSVPAWSPDGRTLAFTHEDGLYTMSADGSGLRLVRPASHRSIWQPLNVAWSPDGGRIAFFDVVGTQPPEVPARYVAMTVRTDGGDPVVLHDAGRCACSRHSPPSVAWSPDGTLIAVAAGLLSSGTGVYTVRPDGSEWTLREPGQWASFSWQPITH